MGYKKGAGTRFGFAGRPLYVKHVFVTIVSGSIVRLHVLTHKQSPAQFSLYTHSLTTVFETPSLISALANYSESRQGTAYQNTVGAEKVLSETPGESLSSVLFLQIYSAADYFSANKTLMTRPLPVAVDISESFSSLYSASFIGPQKAGPSDLIVIPTPQHVFESQNVSHINRSLCLLFCLA